jgi:hypothetical protein
MSLCLWFLFSYSSSAFPTWFWWSVALHNPQVYIS